MARTASLALTKAHSSNPPPDSFPEILEDLRKDLGRKEQDRLRSLILEANSLATKELGTRPSAADLITWLRSKPYGQIILDPPISGWNLKTEEIIHQISRQLTEYEEYQLIKEIQINELNDQIDRMADDPAKKTELQTEVEIRKNAKGTTPDQAKLADELRAIRWEPALSVPAFQPEEGAEYYTGTLQMEGDEILINIIHEGQAGTVPVEKGSIGDLPTFRHRAPLTQQVIGKVNANGNLEIVAIQLTGTRAWLSSAGWFQTSTNTLAEKPAKRSIERAEKRLPTTTDRETAPPQAPIVEKDASTIENRIFLVYEGKLLHTHVPDPGIPHQDIRDEETRRQITQTILGQNTSEEPRRTLKEDLQEHWQLTFPTIDWKKVSVTNLYPGVKGIPGIADQTQPLRLDDLSRMANKPAARTGATNPSETVQRIRIHQRRDLYQWLAQGRFDGSVEDAIVLSQNFHGTTGELGEKKRQIDDQTAVKIIENVNIQNAKPGETPPGQWSFDQLTQFTEECFARAETSDEQIAYLEAFGRWAAQYKERHGANALYQPEETASLQRLRQTIQTHAIATNLPSKLAIDQNKELIETGKFGNQEKVTRRTRIGYPRSLTELGNNPVYRREVKASAQIEIPEEGVTYQKGRYGVLFRDPDANQPEEVHLRLSKMRLELAASNNLENRDQRDKFRLDFYRKHRKWLNREIKEKLIKGTQSVELLLALADDPLLEQTPCYGEQEGEYDPQKEPTYLCKRLADFAPSGNDGEMVQLAALQRAFREGGGRAVVDIIHHEPRSALCKRVADLFYQEPNDEKNIREWQTKMQSPEGKQAWNSLLFELSADISPEEKNAYQTSTFEGYCVGTKEGKNGPVYILASKHGGYQIEVDRTQYGPESQAFMEALRPNIPLIAVTHKRDDGTRFLQNIQNKNPIPILKDENIVKKGGHSAFHETNLDTQCHLSAAVILEAEAASIERELETLRARARDGDIESLLLKRTAELLPPVRESHARKTGALSPIEFALPADAQNPVPGLDQEDTERRLFQKAREWEAQNRVYIEGNRHPDGTYVAGKDGKPINKGLADAIASTFQKRCGGIVPPQAFDNEDVLGKIRLGVVNGQVAVALFERKLSKQTAYDAADELILRRNGGKLPENKEEYLEARILAIRTMAKDKMREAKRSVQRSNEHNQLANSLTIAAKQEGDQLFRNHMLSEGLGELDGAGRSV
jgi:hypothetical protein